MKVLSLTEPCATLIKEKKKLVETRSWKTSYRGELYIHASSTKIPKEWKEDTEFMGIVTDKALNFGNIICAWILEDIKPLDNPIKAKGHLSVWNYEENEKGANNK